MSTKHTPGPWRTLAIAKGRVIGDDTAIGYEKIQVANHNATVATVYRASDARLIAAAPELAEALARLLGCPELNWDETDDESRAAIAFARAALRTAGVIA